MNRSNEQARNKQETERTLETDKEGEQTSTSEDKQALRRKARYEVPNRSNSCKYEAKQASHQIERTYAKKRKRESKFK